MSTPTSQTSPTPRRRPKVVVFDVNETLSDTSPMRRRFTDVGAPGPMFDTWFAGLLRDGFALAVAGAARPFADVGSGLLEVLLSGTAVNRTVVDAVDHIMTGLTELDVHADVVDGVTALAQSGIRLVTLSNGSTDVARTLLGKAGVADKFDAILSVDDAGRWKPHLDAYRYALGECNVAPEEAMLVAVHPWDINGARTAGMATAWIGRNGGPYPSHFPDPDLTAPSITSLAQMLIDLPDDEAADSTLQ
ncbi:haloacid dehalogenase [Rhodococcus sp. Leaf7]|uniref:haloacid dehalogenase type II n=1 Tax=unclassified Rhodococcus (in: high G+C Gram-positive bacteria) TaxID=192944 RepID=UPI0006F5DA8F|nr:MULTISPECIES: haloacid dehalogenase type II [unclassified Rhodococcus (in: high G+C Gram-positive bacteria)]KQU07478.1 haloacid dehalogenase [Rhodococcus sp. Leaf7]KQU43000.1 haloacid dehalogenase [Rhodococcus sp. Leaf247]